MDLSLKLRGDTRLAMTFGLRQALEVLQMPQLELSEWLSQEIEKNPLLNEVSRPKNAPPMPEIASELSLYDHLMGQIREHFSEEGQMVAQIFIENLDELGFLSISLEDLSHLSARSVAELEKVLKVLQTFDPPGIFARNLQESLLLQLKAKGQEATQSYFLIAHCFEDLLHGRYCAIKKAMGQKDLTEVIQKLSRLALRPGHAFRKEVVQSITVDLLIHATEKGWNVEVVDEALPQFEILTAYQSAPVHSAEEKAVLRKWGCSANWLFRCLRRRKKILLQVALYLIRKQTPYLMHQGEMQGLTLREVAQELDLHESTLSRALSGKYADTPRGVIPLRSLLGAPESTGQIKEALIQLIANEDKKKPLSDGQIGQELQKMGHSIARRTIAKYRNELKIPSTSARACFSR